MSSEEATVQARENAARADANAARADDNAARAAKLEAQLRAFGVEPG